MDKGTGERPLKKWWLPTIPLFVIATNPREAEGTKNGRGDRKMDAGTGKVSYCQREGKLP